MTVQLNHTIVHTRDAERASTFLSEVLGVASPFPFGPFQVVRLEDGLELAYLETDEDFIVEHYAFLVGDDDFDAILGRIVERGLDNWADPGCTQPGINTRWDGRGTYFRDPDGHVLEMITVPYGGWDAHT